VITVENLSHSFGNVQVLDGVHLNVECGEFVAVVGPNGAGKSTLLRLINGTLSPDSGTVTLDGTPVSEQSARAVSRQVGTVPQDTSLGFAFTVEQVVEMGRTPHRSRLDWSEEGTPVERALERTQTTDLRDRTINEISGGQRQRVVLARALAQEPDALLLDEPTASLDINHQIRVLDLISELVADGKAVLAAIHDLDLAARYCDRIAVLADGQIWANGPPETVLDDPALERAFGIETRVADNPVTGTPTVTAVPDRDTRANK
jgi:iron complex transport system ATP-binding protein